jgi:glycerophosphoryl diester phosphodiesterase
LFGESRTARIPRRIGAWLAAAAVAGAAAGCAGTSAPAGAGTTADGGTAAAGVSTLPSLAAEGGAAAPYQNGNCDGPSLIAHRGEIGDGRDLPENTWQAELSAAAAGVTYLNMDVRWTADAVPVVLHDPTVDRTTSEIRPDTPITALTAAQYTALDARRYAGDTTQGAVDPQVHPDSLAEMLAKLGPSGKPIVLQMEADPLTPGGAGASAQRDFTDLAQVIEASGYSARVVVAGWTLADLRAFHAVAPYVTLAYLFETIGAAAYPTATELAAAGTRILYIDYRGITKAKTAAWHSAGLKVWAWTPALREQWDKLRTDGVDAIATNWSAAYLNWAPVPCPPGAAS